LRFTGFSRSLALCSLCQCTLCPVTCHCCHCCRLCELGFRFQFRCEIDTQLPRRSQRLRIRESTPSQSQRVTQWMRIRLQQSMQSSHESIVCSVPPSRCCYGPPSSPLRVRLDPLRCRARRNRLSPNCPASAKLPPPRESH